MAKSFAEYIVARYVLSRLLLIGIAIALLFALCGCGPAFIHGPLGPALPAATVQAAADAMRDQLTKTSSTGACWIVFVAADGLTEVRCPYRFVPEGVQIFRQCLDKQWPEGLNLGDGVIVACGRSRREPSKSLDSASLRPED